MGDEGRKFDKAKLFNLVIETAGTEDTPRHKISVKGQKLLNTFLNEKYKYDRFKDANKPKN